MFRSIVLATDGSPASEQATSTAVELARSHGARLTAVYVVDPYPFLGIGDTNPAGLQAYLSAAQQHAARAHARVIEIAGNAVAVQPTLVEDAAAADGILATAKDQGADLIVLGSHGRTGINRVVMGSVAAKVVARSRVPVLVVPASAAGA